MLLFFDQSQSMIFITQLNDGKKCVYLILKNTGSQEDTRPSRTMP